MIQLPHYNSFDLATARDPVAAVLTAGLKLPGGGMRQGSTDRFWIGCAASDSKRPRALHPGFRAFNGSGTQQREGSVHDVAFMRCNLAHGNIYEASRIARSLYRGPKNDPRVKNPRHNGGWCKGDGISATRWDGADYQSIDCPDEKCPFANLPEASCKAELTILFYPRWDETPWADAKMPRVLMKYHSRGRRMRDSWRGLVEHAGGFANGLGVEIMSWIGFPFTMTLTKRRGRSGLCTDVGFAADGDLFDWLHRQQQRRAALGGGEAAGLLAEPENAADAWRENEDLISPEVIASVKPAAVSASVDPEVDLSALEKRVEAAGITSSVSGAYGRLAVDWETHVAEIEKRCEVAEAEQLSLPGGGP